MKLSKRIGQKKTVSSHETCLYVIMKDLLTDETLRGRWIDTSNALGWGSENVTDASMEANINEWIEDRANEQHDTLLELVSFEFVVIGSERMKAIEAEEKAAHEAFKMANPEMFA